MTKVVVTTYSAQSSQPAKRWGQRAKLPLASNLATVHLRAAISADIPDNAVVTKAELVFTAAATWTGSRTFTLTRQTAKFDQTITWDTRPATTTTNQVATALSTPVANKTLLKFNVLPVVQEWIAGTNSNYGWRLSVSGTTTVYLNGSTASLGVPYLDLEWERPGEPPTDLSPDGTIATAQPTLQFQAEDGTTHVQVQISTTEDFAATEYDSGQVVVTGNLFSLASSGYTFPNGATRYWRVRTWGGGIPSEWSAPAEVYRSDHPGLTITAPGSTSGKPVPTVTWTFANQGAWQVLLYDTSSGADRLVADSGRTAGTTQSWTPGEGLRGEGTGRVVVKVWDTVLNRVPTPGVPEYVSATKDFTVTVGGAAAGATSLTVTQRGATPIQDLAWSFAVAPTQVQITRAVDGAPAEFLGDPLPGATTTYADRTAPRYANVVYRALAVDGSGVVSNVGPSELVYPTSRAVWLLDPDADYASTAAVPLLGKEQGSQSMTEQAVVHVVNNRAPVRRRLGLVPPSGSVSGVLMSALGVSATQGFDTLMDWKVNDASKVYRLVLGDWNIPVTIGDLSAVPLPDSGKDLAYAVDFAWWQTDAELPW